MVVRMKFRTSHVAVVAVVAFALALGGGVGAVAGSKWIDGKDIKPHSIPANRVKAISGKQIAKGSLKGDRIAKRTITKSALTAATIDDLEPTLEYVDRVITTTQFVSDPDYALVPATCPEGSQPVGGYVHGDRTAIYDVGWDYVDTATGAFMVRIYAPNPPEEAYAHVQLMCIH